MQTGHSVYDSNPLRDFPPSLYFLKVLLKRASWISIRKLIMFQLKKPEPSVFLRLSSVIISIIELTLGFKCLYLSCKKSLLGTKVWHMSEDVGWRALSESHCLLIL